MAAAGAAAVTAKATAKAGTMGMFHGHPSEVGASVRRNVFFVSFASQHAAWRST